MSTYHLVAGWLAAHPYVLWAAGALFVAGVGWLFHWYVLDVSYWFRRDPRDWQPDYPTPDEWPERSAEHWDEMDADAQADQLIAEWHDDCATCPRCGEHRHGGECLPGLSLDPLAFCRDPEVIEWDTRMQVNRIREIRAELAALRIELLAA